jgi:hypothetical protein
MRKVCVISLLVLTLALTGCGAAADAHVDDVTTALPVDSVRDIAYQFKTDLGQVITVVDDPDIEAVYTTPTSTIDTACTRVPIEIGIGDFIVDIGFCSADNGTIANNNIYQNMYTEVIDQFLSEESSSSLTKSSREKLQAYAQVYPNKIIQTTVNFTGKDLRKDVETVWSASPVDYTDYTKIQVFNLPVITASVPLSTGEILIVHCLATTESGYWQLDELPSLVDIITKDYSDKTTEDFTDEINSMQEGYLRAADVLCSILNNILVGDYSNEYVILSLDSTSLYASDFGIDTSKFDMYAFIRLEDNSIYLVYEKNGLKGCECIAGDSTHTLSTDWDTYDTKTVDETTGDTYVFTWVIN